MTDKIMLKDRWFWSKDHWEDGWTYGDWRQYIARRADGSLQPCRVSQVGVLMFALTMSIAGLALYIVAVVFAHDQSDRLNWAVIISMPIPALVLWAVHLSGYCLMAAVGPRSYDGWRHF